MFWKNATTLFRAACWLAIVLPNISALGAPGKVGGVFQIEGCRSDGDAQLEPLMILVNDTAADTLGEAADKVMDLRGTWVLMQPHQNTSRKSGDTIEITIDHSIRDAQMGSGDLQHINAGRFELTYYYSNGVPSAWSCQIVIMKLINGDISILNVRGNANCPSGTYARSS